MFREPEGRFNIQLFEASPLADITVVESSGGIPHITPLVFPRLFSEDGLVGEHAHLTDEYVILKQTSRFDRKIEEAGGIFTWRYHTRELAMEDLLKISSRITDPLDLAYRQRQIVYPSKGVKRIKGVPLYCYGGLEYKAARFSAEEAEPDFDRGYPAGQPDNTQFYSERAVNTYFALRLAKGTLLNPTSGEHFSFPKQLDSYLLERDWHLDYQALHRGFNKLISQQIINELSQAGQLDKQALDSLYPSVAEWISMLTLYSLNQVGVEAQTFPYKFPVCRDKLLPDFKTLEIPAITDQGIPAIGFLPYLGDLLLQYIGVLPEFIQPGERVEFKTLTRSVEDLYNFSEAVLTDELKRELRILDDRDFRSSYKRALIQDPPLAAKVKAVADELIVLKDSFNGLLDLYRRRPRILNRAVAGLPSPREVASYAKRREEILAHGAHSSRKPLLFRMIADIHRGQV